MLSKSGRMAQNAPIKSRLRGMTFCPSAKPMATGTTGCEKMVDMRKFL
jgi:hypothetical protein